MVVAFLFVLGVCVGSFLNVVVLRFGFLERSGERSHCAQCGAQLTSIDLVPILSYLAFGGRCRRCGSSISLQYPLVEFLTGCLFVITYITLVHALTLSFLLLFVAYLGFWSALVALVVYDIRHTLIPLPFVYALTAFAALGVGARALTFLSYQPLIDAALGALICGGFFALIHFATRGRGMGIGDAYVACAIGIMLGLESGIVASVLAVWLGAIVGLVALGILKVFPHARLLVGGKRVTLTAEIPFAPFLALGAIIAFTTHIAPLALGFWGVPY